MNRKQPRKESTREKLRRLTEKRKLLPPREPGPLKRFKPVKVKGPQYRG